MPGICRQKFCLTLLVVVLGCARAAGFDRAYWAWQRNEPPGASEIHELTGQGVRVIYWQVGELIESGATWRWSARFDLPANTGELRFVPVVRLESRERTPFSTEANASLLSALAETMKGRDELQIDYDAPDRLIGGYAALLKQLHKLVPRLTITGLPHWSHTSAVRELRGAADELLVMLYDFEPDAKGSAPLPLIVPEKIERYLKEWNNARIPWRAGMIGSSSPHTSSDGTASAR